mgnify:CR=1 FL=1
MQHLRYVLGVLLDVCCACDPICACVYVCVCVCSGEYCPFMLLSRPLSLFLLYARCTKPTLAP